jgi:hypothetical protein
VLRPMRRYWSSGGITSSLRPRKSDILLLRSSVVGKVVGQGAARTVFMASSALPLCRSAARPALQCACSQLVRSRSEGSGRLTTRMHSPNREHNRPVAGAWRRGASDLAEPQIFLWSASRSATLVPACRVALMSSRVSCPPPKASSLPSALPQHLSSVSAQPLTPSSRPPMLCNAVHVQLMASCRHRGRLS